MLRRCAGARKLSGVLNHQTTSSSPTVFTMKRFVPFFAFVAIVSYVNIFAPVCPNRPSVEICQILNDWCVEVLIFEGWTEWTLIPIFPVLLEIGESCLNLSRFVLL